MFEYLGVSSAKRGEAKCPRDHQVNINTAHDVISKLAAVCVGMKGAKLPAGYLAKLQDIHDKLVEVGADCPAEKVREAVEAAADKVATLRKCLESPRGLGRDALPSACADTLQARLQLCHQVPRVARSGHDLYRRRS